MKHAIWILACSLALHTDAQVRMPATTRADLATLQALGAREPNALKLFDATRGRFPVALVNGR